MAEYHILTTPATTSVTTYKVSSLLLDAEGERVEVIVKDNLGHVVRTLYHSTTTPTGRTLLITLNKANLSTNSLQKRVLKQLASDGGVDAGTATGSPD